MSCEMGVSFKDGSVWYVGVDTVVGVNRRLYPDEWTHIQVIVPVERLGNLTNEEIGDRVRRCIPFAKLLAAEELASEWQGRTNTDDISSVRGVLKSLEPFEEESEKVARSLAEIREHLAFMEERESKKRIHRAPNISLRKKIIIRDNDRCRYCGNPAGEKPHIDHVVPYSLGGLTEIDNLVLACPTCNHKKAGRTLEEADMVLLPVPEMAVSA